MLTEGSTSLGQLSAALRERDLSVTIYTLNDGYAVWAFAADDPALGIFPGEGPELADALQAALLAWDNAEIEEVVIPDVGEEKPS
jgi:hypothetical protein